MLYEYFRYDIFRKQNYVIIRKSRIIFDFYNVESAQVGSD